jgi:DNA-binding MarR family transcriptional regulator
MIQKERDNLVEGILSLGDKLFRILLPTVPQELLEMDITMQQLKIMLLLFMNGPLRMGTIASQLDVTLPTATNFIDRLVERDYVVRENMIYDRRVVICHLSAKGQKTVGSIWESARNRCKELLESMNTAKLKFLNEALEAMMDSASAGAASSGTDNSSVTKNGNEENGRLLYSENLYESGGGKGK